MSVKLVGRDDVAADAAAVTNGYIILIKFTAVASSVGDSIHIRCNGNVNIKLGLYSDNAGAPNVLLASVGSTACVSGVNIIAFPNVSITVGTVYWLAVNSDATMVGSKNETISSQYKALTYANAFPNPAGTGYTSITTPNYFIGGLWGEVTTVNYLTNYRGRKRTPGMVSV